MRIVRGRSPADPRSAFRSSAARTVAHTCLQGSPPSKNAQEQKTQTLASSRRSETRYSSPPETTASTSSGPAETIWTLPV